MTTHLLDSDCTIDYFFDKNNAVSRLSPFIERGDLATSIIVFGEVQEGLIDDPNARD